MSRRDGANAAVFVEKPGPLLCHLRAPIVPKLGTRQGQPKKYISAQRDMMYFNGGLFCF